MFPGKNRDHVIVGVLGLAAWIFGGCGGGAFVAAGSSVSNDNLNGNWLLVGTLPFADLSGTVTNPLFGVAGTFSVVGSNVVGALSANVPCGTFVLSEPVAVMTGTIAADGSLSMQSVSSGSSGTASLTGMLPMNSGSAWSGNLALSLPASACAFSKQTNFTAVKIADVTGTYVGSATISLFPGSGTQTVSYRFVLQQGGTLGSSTTEFASALTGTVTVQGSTCFTSGVFAAPQSSSGVLGSELVANTMMNDGSGMAGVGQIMDTGALQLDMSGLVGSGGSCGLYSVSPLILTRQ
jgi:hypothetical protein